MKIQIIFSSALAIVFFISSILNIDKINSKPEYNEVYRFIKTTNVFDNQKYSIAYSDVYSSNFYLKKFNLNFQTYDIKFDLKNIESILNDAKENNIETIWYINDNTINNERIVNFLKNQNILKNGFRYKGVTLYEIHNSEF